MRAERGLPLVSVMVTVALKTPLPSVVEIRPATGTSAAVTPMTVSVPFCEVIVKFAAASFEALTFESVRATVPPGAFGAIVKVMRKSN